MADVPTRYQFGCTVQKKILSAWFGGSFWETVKVLGTLASAIAIGFVAESAIHNLMFSAIATLMAFSFFIGSLYVRCAIDECYLHHCEHLKKINVNETALLAARCEVLSLKNETSQTPPSLSFVKQIIEHLIHEGYSASSRGVPSDMQFWHDNTERFVGTALSLKHQREFDKYGREVLNHPDPERRRIGNRIEVLTRILPTFNDTDIKHDCTDADLHGWKVCV